MKFKQSSDIEKEVKKDYTKKIIFSPSDFTQTGHLLQEVTIPPNTKQRAHYHSFQTEIFYILEGETIIHINGNDYAATPGDAFICEPQDKHYLWNKSDKEFKLIVFKINKIDNSDDTIWLEQ